MTTPLPRRDALKSLGLAAVSTLAAATAMAADKNPAKPVAPKESEIGFKDGKYVLPPLPYPPEALEPAIDAQTMSLHHDKHHLAYVEGANKAVDGLKAIAAGTGDAAMLPLFNSSLSFNLSGHVLHTVFWNNLKPGGSKLAPGPLLDAMKEAFGSPEGFEKLFTATALAVQGSGWAILGYNYASGRLATVGVEKHNNAVIQGLVPLLVCDVWEHAYYLKYQNKRADYVKAFFTVVNYEDVAARLVRAMG